MTLVLPLPRLLPTHCTGPHLKEIQLGNNKNVTGDLSVLSVCTSIAVVSMPFTSVTGDIEVVTHWPQLAKLDLQDCVAITGDISTFVCSCVRMFVAFSRATQTPHRTTPHHVTPCTHSRFL